MSNEYQKFTKDVLVVGISNLLIALSSLIFIPLITKTLGADEYGIWVQVQITINLMTAFVGLGLPYSLNRFLAATKDKVKIQEEFWSVFLIVSLISLAVSLLFIAFADFIAQAFFEGATDVVRISGLIILISSLNIVFLNFFRSLRQMIKYALFLVATTYGQLGLITYLILNGYGILSMVIAVLCINVLIFLALLVLVKGQIGIKRPHFSRMREYLSFGLPIIPSNISAWVVYSSDRFVIAHFLGATSVGIYSAAYSLGSMPMLIGTILSLVLPPTLSRLYDEGKIHELKIHLSYSLKYALFVVIPFVFGASVLAVPVLTLFSTPEIASGGYPILIFESINSLFLITGGVISEILIPVKKTRISGVAWTMAAIANLGLNLLMIPIFGIIGAAISTLVCCLIAEGIQVYYSLKAIRFSLDWVSIVKSLLSSVIMSIVIWLMHPVDSMGTILTIIAGCAVYIVLLIIMRGFKKEEINFFIGLVQQISVSRIVGNKTK